MSSILAIDFGTSNSAMAMMKDGVVTRLPVSAQADTLPTAVFFPEEGGPMLIGDDALAALIAGDEGRFMRALKSILGTALFHERRMIAGKQRSLAQIVTAFISTLKDRAQQATGQQFSAVLSGRPVHFHSSDPARDAQAEADLRACYRAAGFQQVDFLFEPEAAALASHQLASADQLGLIVDIGGGTSDFTVFRRTDTSAQILSSHGLRLGGTDFDHAVSMSHAMPLLGRGGELHRALGQGLLPVPNAIYSELAAWAKIPFLYTRSTLGKVQDMHRHAVDPDRIKRLLKVIEDQQGHQLALSVEQAKIAANSGQDGAAIQMGFIEAGLTAPIDATSLGAALSDFQADLGVAMHNTLASAGVTPQQIGTVVMVGGSSLMTMVAQAAGAVCPAARISYSDAFTAVVDGLALATETMQPALP